MTVTDKQNDIAILRTLGATPRAVMRIFIVQGAFSGVIGTLAGLLLGAAGASQCGRDRPVPAIERLLGNVNFLPGSIYLIRPHAQRPAFGRHRAHRRDLPLLLAFVATLYPRAGAPAASSRPGAAP